MRVQCVLSCLCLALCCAHVCVLNELSPFPSWLPLLTDTTTTSTIKNSPRHVLCSRNPTH